MIAYLYTREGSHPFRTFQGVWPTELHKLAGSLILDHPNAHFVEVIGDQGGDPLWFGRGPDDTVWTMRRDEGGALILDAPAGLPPYASFASRRILSVD